MGKKISAFLKSEIISSLFYMVFGLCLILIPEQTIHVICKVIFGIVMIGAGIYHIWIYAGEKEKATILDLFTGVIVLVLGIFLFFTPQIIIKILPYLLGAFVLVDNIWMLKGSWKLKKLGNSHWKILLIGSIVFAAAGVAVMVYPFEKITDTVLLAGGVMLADGLCDLVFMFLLRRGVKKGMVQTEPETGEKPEVEKPEIDEGEDEDELENEVIINGRWKAAPEEESPEKEIQSMVLSHEAVSEEKATTDEPEKNEIQLLQEEEVLEEWKD